MLVPLKRLFVPVLAAVIVFCWGVLPVRAGYGGRSPRSGIHYKVDAPPDRAGLKPEELTRDLKVPELPDAFAAAIAAIEESAGKVEKVYGLEAALPAPTGDRPEKLDPTVRALALERCRAGAALTAGLWLSAWQASASSPLKKCRGSRCVRTARMQGARRKPCPKRHGDDEQRRRRAVRTQPEGTLDLVPSCFVTPPRRVSLTRLRRRSSPEATISSVATPALLQRAARVKLPEWHQVPVEK